MLVEYLSYYLIFIIVFSVLVSLIVLKLKLRKPYLVIPIMIAIVILPAPFFYVYLTYFSPIPEVVVPDMTGIRLEDAFVKLESLNLKGRHAGNIYNMKYPAGRVVTQRPGGGRKVKIGRTVSLLTSSGKRRVLVPNLLGRPAAQAEAVLSAKGLFLGKVTKDYVPELDPGIILTQNLLPGEEVNVGRYVSITVSSTEEPIVVEERESGQGAGEKEGGFWPWD